MTKVYPITFNKAWRFWAEGYFNLAEQGLLYFKNKKNLGKENLIWDKKDFIKRFGKGRYEKDNKKQFSLEEGHMLVAVIWNIKHGIEILIKALGIKINKRYWFTHNLGDLKNELRKKIAPFCVKKHFIFFEKIIDKYYQCTFSAKTVFLDTENTFLKYPESKDRKTNKVVSLDYSFVHNIKRKDINQFLKDVYNLKRLGSILETSIARFQSAQKRGISKKEQQKRLMSVPTMKNPGFK